VLYTNTIYFENFTPLMAHSIQVVFNAAGFGTGVGAVDVTVQYSIAVEGNQIVSEIVTINSGNFVFPTSTVLLGTPQPTITRTLGYVFTTATPSITITINAPRSFEDSTSLSPGFRVLSTSLVILKYANAYNPVTDCCVVFCPANSGVTLGINGNPPTCVTCTAGLVFNSVTGACQCQTGYYSVTQSATTNITQCFPCYAPLCQSCNSTTRATCNACVTGA